LACYRSARSITKHKRINKTTGNSRTWNSLKKCSGTIIWKNLQWMLISTTLRYTNFETNQWLELYELS
jgi:hypothetical protein